MDGPLAEGLAHYYLDDIFGPEAQEPHPDTMLLGCTHFPLLQGALERVVGPKVTVVDPAATVALSVRRVLEEQSLLSPEDREAEHHFMTTDNQKRFAKTGSLFLGRSLCAEEIELIDL